MTDLFYNKSPKWIKKLSKRSCECKSCISKIYWGVWDGEKNYVKISMFPKAYKYMTAYLLLLKDDPKYSPYHVEFFNDSSVIKVLENNGFDKISLFFNNKKIGKTFLKMYEQTFSECRSKYLE